MATYTKYKKSDGTTSHRAMIRLPGGGSKSLSFKSKAEAKEWAREKESKAYHDRTGTIPTKTFDELLERYIDEVSVTKKSCAKEVIRLTATRRMDIAKVNAQDITAKTIGEWMDERKKTVAESTVLREWGTLSDVCSIAAGKWGWLKQNPFRGPGVGKHGVKRPKDGKARKRIASDEELATIAAAAFGATQHKLVLAALFAVETAMRAGELYGLTSDRVDLKHNVAHLVDTWEDRADNNGEFVSIKTGVDRDVPLTPEAVRLWHAAGGEGFKLEDSQPDRAWRRLCARAKVVNLHFHDLRHTAITRMVTSGEFEVLELAAITGHKDIKQLMEYYTPSAIDFAKRMRAKVSTPSPVRPALRLVA